MSKFVTYPAVTVLDNDQSLLIDSPNAGTNSITAENAGNTLLSKWAGFDTFDEAVQNTISNNQEFIDRDAAIRSETADLKRKIVTTFPAKDASGQIATFESEFEDAPLKSCIVQVNPVQDLHGYDHPWPAGGGKNVLNTLKPSYGGTATNRYYVEFSVNSGYSKPATLIAGQTYTISYNLHSSVYPCTASVGCGAGSYSRDIKTIDVIADGRVSITFTPTETDLAERPYFAMRPVRYTQATTFDWSIENIQLELGSTATDYAPYSNECPISGFTGVEVQRTGENLIPDDIEYVGKYGVDANGKVKNGVYYTVYFPIPKGTLLYHADTTQVVSAYTLIDEPLAVGVQTTGVLSLTNYNNRLIDNTAGHKYLMLMVTTVNDTVAIEHIKEFGVTFLDQDYAPGVYTEPKPSATYPITFPSEAGTVYGAYVDVINGELVVDRVEVADLGTLSWSYGTTSNPPRFFASLPYSGKNDPWWVTDAMLSTGGYTLGTNVGQDGVDKKYGISTKIIYFTNAEYTNADDFKASITGTQVVYRIATPIHYPLTPQEIKTLLGTNNIWANTGDVSVEYLMSDVGWYVEKKLRAFQSILAGVEDSSTASKNYSANTYLVFNDDIYKTTKTITAGETIEDGVNVTKTTVAEQLMALAQV